MNRKEYKSVFNILPENTVWDLQKNWVLEIGPGRGDFLLWLAKQNSQKLFIAVELRTGRFLRICQRLQTEKIENVIMIHGDARGCIPLLFNGKNGIEKKLFSEIYILFPDPWPKRRHHKHRLLNRERMDQLHTFLEKGGSLWVATDHEGYSQQIIQVFDPQKWELQPSPSLYPTYFETKWKGLGKKISYFRFRKV